MQAHLGDIKGLVPDHLNKANIIIEQVTKIFFSFSVCIRVTFTIHYSLLMEKVMAPHSSTLAWKIPWTEEPGRLQPMGSLGVGHD